LCYNFLQNMNRRQNGKILFVCLILGTLLSAEQVFSAPNLQINYQGKLTDSLGVIVVDGNYNLRFKLYTASSGGTALWTESRTSSNRVAVTDGLFSILLGSVTDLSAIDFNQTLYLGVEVGGTGDANWDGEMTPRKTLGSVPAAFEADKLDGLTSAQFLRSDATNATSTTSTFLTFNQSGTGAIADFQDGGTSVFKILDGGNVGVGTSTPYARLSVVGEAVADNFTATSSTAASTFYTDTAGAKMTFDPADHSLTLGNGLLDNQGISLFVHSDFTGEDLSYDRTSATLVAPRLQVGSSAQFNMAYDGTLSADWSAGTSRNIKAGAFYTYQADPTTGVKQFATRDGGSGYRPLTFSTVASADLFLGSDTQVMFRDGNNGVVGDADLTWNKTTDTLAVSVLDVASTTATSTFAGGVAIATSTAVSTLSVQGSLCVRSTGSCGIAAGEIYTTGGNIVSIDVAENYPVLDESLEAGDIVALAGETRSYPSPLDAGKTETVGALIKAQASRSEPMLGVISTRPGLLFGYDIKGVPVRPVALSGRVPTKVNLEGGEIAVGDRLSVSAVPGIGKKAVPGEQTVGIALEPFTSRSLADRIMVFVNLQPAPFRSQ